MKELIRMNHIFYNKRDCNNADECHPCDIKVKRDRFKWIWCKGHSFNLRIV